MHGLEGEGVRAKGVETYSEETGERDRHVDSRNGWVAVGVDGGGNGEQKRSGGGSVGGLEPREWQVCRLRVELCSRLVGIEVR